MTAATALPSLAPQESLSLILAGRLSLAWQPVRSAVGTPFFEEGLARLTLPCGAVAAAGDWVPALEAACLSAQLDRAALELALERLGRERTLRLSVNLSAANLAVAFLGIGAIEDFETLAMRQALVVAAVAILPLRQYALFRVRRYRLSRTRWRGIRFGMDGSGLSMVRLWVLWTPLVVLSAGFAFPLWRWARERHMARRMRWGQARFTLEGNAFRLLPAFLPFYAAVALIGAAAISPGVRTALGPFDPYVVANAGPVAIVAMGATVAFVLWALWTTYRAAEIRCVLGGLGLEGARLRSTLSATHLIDAYFLVMRRNLWPGIGGYIFIGIVTAVPLFSAVGAEMSSFGEGGLLGSEGLEQQLFEGFTTWRAQGLVLMSMVLN